MSENPAPYAIAYVLHKIHAGEGEDVESWKRESNVRIREIFAEVAAAAESSVIDAREETLEIKPENFIIASGYAERHDSWEKTALVATFDDAGKRGEFQNALQTALESRAHLPFNLSGENIHLLSRPGPAL